MRGTPKQIFEQACKNNKIESNPVRGIILPEAKEDYHRPNPWRIPCCTICEAHRGDLCVRLMLQCGLLRRGETIPIRWGGLDDENGSITIYKAVEFVTPKAKTTVKQTKTKADTRKVPISPNPLLILKAHPKAPKSNIITFSSQKLCKTS